MDFESFMADVGSEVARDLVYTRAARAGAETPLRLSVFRPAAALRPAPVLVWLQGDAFGRAASAPGVPLRLARQMTYKGIALVVPEVRLAADADDLPPALRRRMAELPLPLHGLPAGPEALAAMADAVACLGWLEAARDRIGLAGRPVLGGTAAGALTAFNVSYAAPAIGLDRPEPGGILSYSGGFAWPGLFVPGRYPVFALHNPFDTRIPVQSVRRLAETDPDVELIEAFDHGPGTLRVWPQEPRDHVFGRIRTLVRGWSGGTPS